MNEATTAHTGTGTMTAAQGPAAETTANPPARTPHTGTIAGGTAIATSGGGHDALASAADWPSDWRDRFAQSIKPGDRKFRERLERFNAPTDIGKSWLEAQAKISTGAGRAALPPGANAEEVAAWKVEQGLPLEAGDYIAGMELPKGVVFGEAETPLVESFAQAALNNNWDQGTYNQALSWWSEEQIKLSAAREAADDEFHNKSDEALRAEWGNDYRKNVNAIGNILATLPDEMHIRDGDRTEVGGVLLAARLPNGRLLGDHPAFVKWLANQARELNPTATLLPAGSGDAVGVDTEIDRIEKLMKDRTSDYWRGPKSDQLQQRYRDLLDGRARRRTRAA